MIDTDVDAIEVDVHPDVRLEAFRPVRLRKAADVVVAVLIDAIRGGIYRTGDCIPRERDLAAQLEVSRTTVREAIGILQRAGIVSVRRGNKGGTFVASVASLHALLHDLRGDTQLSLRSLLEVRRPLELQSTLLASDRARPEDIAMLQGLVDRLMAVIGESHEFLATDIQFHLRIARVAQNEQLEEFLDSYFKKWLSIQMEYPVGHIGFELAIANQQNLLDAIASGDRNNLIRRLDEHLTPTEMNFLGDKLAFP